MMQHAPLMGGLNMQQMMQMQMVQMQMQHQQQLMAQQRMQEMPPGLKRQSLSIMPLL